MDWLQKLAIERFGGVPAGKIFGMQVLVRPDMPNDRIRFVDPRTGAFSDILLPK